jgi:hypothetical protein
MAAQAASIGLPTVGGVQKSMMSYGVGILAGIGYNFVKGFTGSGLIGGALAAAVAGAAVRGPIGEMIAVNLGFNVGLLGVGQFGLDRLLPAQLAGSTQSPEQPQFELL